MTDAELAEFAAAIRNADIPAFLSMHRYRERASVTGHDGLTAQDVSRLIQMLTVGETKMAAGVHLWNLGAALNQLPIGREVNCMIAEAKRAVARRRTPGARA